VPKAGELSIETTGFVPFGSFNPVNPVTEAEPLNFPEVEIFSPKGKFVGQRPCLDVWQLWNTGKSRKQMRVARPRKPMSGAKKREKTLRRNVPET